MEEGIYRIQAVFDFLSLSKDSLSSREMQKAQHVVMKHVAI